ncbi:MAG TPA: RNA polymerase sigma factor, partial [Kofleriaceae bacterium]|nr:RNA polymerase sigma factor [Kofleriaceae bacterium]
AGRPPPAQIRPWLASILRNAFIDRIRRKAVTFESIDDAPQPDAEAAPPWADVTIDEVRTALARIDEHLRLAFDLHYLQGLRYREVAKRLAIAENTVASRLFRARQALRDELARARAGETAKVQEVREVAK